MARKYRALDAMTTEEFLSLPVNELKSEKQVFARDENNKIVVIDREEFERG